MIVAILNKLTAIILFICAAGLLYHVSRLNTVERKKVKKIQNNKNCDTIKVLNSRIEASDELRNKVIDELSRQKLVFSNEEKTWLRRRQID